MKKILYSIVLFIFVFQPYNLFADSVYYLDFKFILNESEAGRKLKPLLKKN